MLPIAHFAIGSTFGIILLLIFNFKDELKWDLAIIFGSGLWALLPDIPALFGNFSMDNSWVANFFWFHQWVDVLPDTILMASIFIAIAVVGFVIYYSSLGKKKPKHLRTN